MSTGLTPMTEPEARRATERIRVALDRVSTAWQDLAERVTDAYQRRADLALGYASWAEYAKAEFNVPTLATEVRRDLVALLSAQGMSTRAIAPVAGVSHKTVVKDRQVVPEVPPETTVAPVEPAEAKREPHKAAPVTGLDGKAYKQPKSKPRDPRRMSEEQASECARRYATGESAYAIGPDIGVTPGVPGWYT